MGIGIVSILHGFNGAVRTSIYGGGAILVLIFDVIYNIYMYYVRCLTTPSYCGFVGVAVAAQLTDNEKEPLGYTQSLPMRFSFLVLTYVICNMTSHDLVCTK